MAKTASDMTDAELEQELARRKAAQVRVQVAYIPPGTDTKGNGLFLTVNPKIEVTVKRGDGKERKIREDVPVMLALLGNADAIVERIAELTGSAVAEAGA